MTTFLPWWVTAISLAILTVGFYLALHRPLGVSGSWARIVMWKNDKIIQEAEAPFRNNPKMLKDALMAATIKEFGQKEVMEYIESRHKHVDANVSPGPVASMPAYRTPWTAHLLFLTMLVLGGLIGAAIKGDIQIQTNLGPVHTSLFGQGMGALMMLFFGGLMVGFGTQMAGGCTSGHGLSGVSRLVPASIIATLVFFGSAILFSMIAHYMGS